jgi:gamma-glutamylaminecyclotransferase
MMGGGDTFILFVNGTLMRGQPLHRNLVRAEFIGEVNTAPMYRLYSIGDEHPGMFEVDDGGVSVRGELYAMTEEVWSRVKSGEPRNLYKGRVKLEDGRMVDGILYPRRLAEGRHRDISDIADWREYMRRES